MHFTLSSLATAGTLIAAANAIPQFGFGGSHHSHGANPSSGFATGLPFPSGVAGPTGGQRSGRPAPSGGIPSVSFNGTGPLETFAPVPSGISSIEQNVAAAAASTSKSSKTKTSKTKSSSKTSTAEEATVTSAPANSSSVASGTKTASGTTFIANSAAATTTFPEAAGSSSLSEPMVVTGEFDGGMVRFDRGTSCTGQDEGGDSDAVFQIEEGGTLKNVIIGADQIEGVHCLGACTIENVWWEAVCEDALTIKQESGVSYVIGGGAKGAEDKVVQHNGGGTVSISGFYVSDFGKLYRSCGNCDTMYERHVIIDGVVADSGKLLAGINSNYGDTATITNSCVTDTTAICEEFEGNDTGDEPTEISTGISDSCIYTDADVATC